MLAETITLSYDPENDGTPVNRVFRRFSYDQNRSVYIGPDHTSLMNETITFYRAEIKKSGNFAGTAKVRYKYSKDYSVPGVDSTSTIKAAAINEGSFSLPVGMTVAEIKAFRQIGVSIQDNDAVIGPVTETQEI